MFQSPPLAPVRALEVYAAVGDLSHAIEELTNNIDVLTERLQSVLRETDTPKGGGECRSKSPVLLAEDINAQTDRLRYLDDKIASLLSRLGV
jgi:uncharacterized protein YoxC